jgi:hypothetical protein
VGIKIPAGPRRGRKNKSAGGEDPFSLRGEKIPGSAEPGRTRILNRRELRQQRSVDALPSVPSVASCAKLYADDEFAGEILSAGSGCFVSIGS